MHVSPRRGERKKCPQPQRLRLQEVTGGDRAIPFREALCFRASEGSEAAGCGQSLNKDRRDAAVTAQQVSAASRSTSRKSSWKPCVPFLAKRGTGHGEGCDNGRPGQSERSEVCRAEAKR